MLVLLKVPPKGQKVTVVRQLTIPDAQTRQAVLDITCAVLNGANRPVIPRLKLRDEWREIPLDAPLPRLSGKE